MNNLVLFLNGFLSYLLVYVVFAVGIVVAVIAGIKFRKSKNAKEAVATEDVVAEN